MPSSNLHEMRRIIATIIVISVASLFWGCPPAKEAAKAEPPKPSAKKPPSPEIGLTVASINLSKLAKRIELDDIRQFALELRKDRIDILLMEGVSRYPGVDTRV